MQQQPNYVAVFRPRPFYHHFLSLFLAGFNYQFKNIFYISTENCCLFFLFSFFFCCRRPVILIGYVYCDRVVSSSPHKLIQDPTTVSTIRNAARGNLLIVVFVVVFLFVARTPHRERGWCVGLGNEIHLELGRLCFDFYTHQRVRRKTRWGKWDVRFDPLCFQVAKSKVDAACLPVCIVRMSTKTKQKNKKTERTTLEGYNICILGTDTALGISFLTPVFFYKFSLTIQLLECLPLDRYKQQQKKE